MVSLSQRTKFILFIAIVLIVGSGIFAIRGSLFTQSVPQEFRDARLTGAAVAGRIVDLANQTKEDLLKIEEADRMGNYSEAVQIVEQALEKNREARAKAVELSLELQRMTQMIPKIRPSQARLIALEAINTELTLVSHLITHNDYLFQLLGALSARFSGERGAGERIADLIRDVNLEIAAINNLNQRFTELMVQFDVATR